MKKALSVLLGGVMCATMALSLAGCGGGSNSIKVVMMTNAEQKAYYEAHFRDLSESLGVEIEFKGYAYQDYDNQLMTEMQSSKVPDLFYIGPGNVKRFVDLGLLTDLNDYIASEDFTSRIDLSRIYPHTIDMFRYDGTNVGVANASAPLYGFNLGFSYQGLGYNRKLVQLSADKITQAGLPLPWELGTEGKQDSYTFEQFSQVLSLVRSNTGGGLSGTDTIYGMNVPTELMPFVWTMGGDIMDNAGNVTVNNAVFTDVLTYIKSNIDNGNMSSAATWGEWSTDQVAFFTEVGSWEVAGYRQSGLDFDMMPWPTTDGGNNWYGQIGTTALAVHSSSSNPELAMRIGSSFLEERTHDDMLRRGLILPFYAETAEGGYLDDDETYHPANRQIFIDVVSGERGKYSPINNTYTSEWYDIFVNSLDFVWNGTQSIPRFLESIQTQMQGYYDLYR